MAASTRRLAGALSIGLVALFIFAVPRDQPSEYTLERRWVCSLDGEPPQAGGEDLVPFVLGARFGYVTKSGELAHLEPVRHGVAVSDGVYANYGNVVQNLVLQRPGGRIVAGLGPTGYPIFRSGRLLTIGSLGTRLSEWDIESGLLWRRQFDSLITALAADGDLLAAGLLSGSVVLVGRDGSVVGRLEPGQSSIAAVYGVDLSGSGAAVVSGLDPQLLSVYARSEDGWVQTVVRRLSSRFVRPVFVDLLEDVVYYETEAGVGMARGPEWEQHDLPVRGNLVSGIPNVGPGLAGFVTRNGATVRLILVDSAGTAVVESDFAADAIWLGASGGDAYLGLDSAIVCFSIDRS